MTPESVPAVVSPDPPALAAHVRQRLASVLCGAREPGHHDPDFDYCQDCLDQADRLLDEDERVEELLAAIGGWVKEGDLK